MPKEVMLTAKGREQLIEELEYLETDKRAEVGERIQRAREFGDISENSEYDDAKNEQAWVESRISEINEILANADVIESSGSDDYVTLGQTVTLLKEGGSEITVTIVGTTEASWKEGKISNESPLGSALLGHAKGDKVEVCTPSGDIVNYTIQDVVHES